MTHASWFSFWARSRRRRTQTGARRNRSRAFHRSASFEALEGRFLLATVSFSTGSETVNASAGTFSIPVTLSGSIPNDELTAVPFTLGGSAVAGTDYSGLQT